MRTILLILAAIAGSLTGSSTPTAAKPKPAHKQFVVDALVLCRSQVLVENNEAIGFRFQKCAILPPGYGTDLTVQPTSQLT